MSCGRSSIFAGSCVNEVEAGAAVERTFWRMATHLWHDLSTTGVPLRTAQAAMRHSDPKLMRHSDYRTTLRHYTVLGLHDTAAAVARLPGVGLANVAALEATGTTDKAASTPQLFCQLLGRETARRGAAGRDERTRTRAREGHAKPQQTAAFSHDIAVESDVERKRLELSTPSLQS